VGGIMPSHCRRTVVLENWTVAFDTGVGWEGIHVMLSGRVRGRQALGRSSRVRGVEVSRSRSISR
jgi:hypothetical protein